MKTLVAGWFSFEDGHATAGDLLACDVACEWLARAGHRYDVALAPPFTGGVDWRRADAEEYSHVVFLCGPFERGEMEAEFLDRFARCRLLGLNLSMPLPLEEWNPFDHLIERDSPTETHADVVFLSRQQLRPVVGVCLVESYPEARTDFANAAIDRLLAMREVCPVRIDTRLDTNEAGLQSPADVESLIARMDVLVTTRLHGMVFALKNGVPALVIDAVPGGGKIQRQSEKIGWTTTLTLDRLTTESLQRALDHCLTEAARIEAAACARRARELAQEVQDEFIAALLCPESWEAGYQARMTPQGMHRFVKNLPRTACPLLSRVTGALLASQARQQLRRVAGRVVPVPVRRWFQGSTAAAVEPPAAI